MLGDMLLTCWTLTADVLEAEETAAPQKGFSLPGAADLMAFSDLLGIDGEENAQEVRAQGRPFSLPGMLPPEAKGCACLSREVDFGRLQGKHAFLEIDHLCGTGSIALGEETLCAFGDGPVSLDLTDALRLGRKQTLCIRFDDAGGAGICGAAVLHTAGDARIESIALSPDAAKQTLGVAVRICMAQTRTVGVRAALAGTAEKSDAPWRVTRAALQKGVQEVCFSLSMRAPRFQAGQPYQPPVLKVSLYVEDGRQTVLTDSRTVMTGHPGNAPKFFVPLTPGECTAAPDALLACAQALGVSALYLPMSAPDLLARRATLAGVALLTYAPEGRTGLRPCETALKRPLAVDGVPPGVACWQLCGMPAMPPEPDAHALEGELLADAAGRWLDTGAPDVAARMDALRAQQIRLRAEAARQGQYAGTLCAPGEWKNPLIASALREALAPLHLSVLPLRGAWWARSFFSATLQAFIPEEMRSGAYAAEAVLLSEDGAALASFRRDCTASGGSLGVIEGRLPDHPCVLTLRTRLYRSGAVVEELETPVYVGERGPLEAAFS